MIDDDNAVQVLAELHMAQAEVQAAIDGAVSSWEAQQQHFKVADPVPAYRAMDSTGRPLLADLLAAKANLLAARTHLWIAVTEAPS